MQDTREIELFWTVHRGNRRSIAISEADALIAIRSDFVYDDDPAGWSVERTTEVVSVAKGELIEVEREVIALDDAGSVKSRKSCTMPHVFWYCPLCGERHSTDLFDDPLAVTSPRSNPSVWFCERGKGIVLIHW